ncbi:MAG: hypothetical protein ABW125_17005 [Candidatus Thiodiazotropha lotti]
MNELMWPIIGLTAFSVATMVGIFFTKTPGFGKYTTSVVLLSIVLFTSAFFLLFGLIKSDTFANVLFAIAGYGGGLINGKKSD